MYNNNFEKWAMHLKAASVIVQSFLRSSDTDCGYINLDVQQSDAASDLLDQSRHANMEGVDLAAMRYLIPLYVRVDILSCAFLRHQHPVSNHERIVQELGSNAPDEFNQQKSFLLAIAQISDLDCWKRRTAEAGKLSTLELISRGMKIKRRLQSVLSESQVFVPEVNPSKVEPFPLVAFGPGWETELGNAIAANAALTYLYVVLLGAYPDLPEIRDSVAATLHLFRHLANQAPAFANLLPSLLWSLCISGCMTVQQNQASFRGLAESASKIEGSGPLFSNLVLVALGVMEQCWAMRLEQPNAEIDWTAATRRLGKSCWFV